MTAYALTLSDSQAKEAAFGKLHSIRRDAGETVAHESGCE